MPFPFAIPIFGSSITNMLATIRLALIDSGLYVASQVFVSIDPDPWPTLSGPFCAIRPGDCSLADEQWDGAGAFLAGYRGEVIVRVADQNMQDEVGRDNLALLTTGTGLLDVAFSVIELLTGDAVSRGWLDSGLIQTDPAPTWISRPAYRRKGASRADRRWRAIDLGFEIEWTHVYGRGMSP